MKNLNFRSFIIYFTLLVVVIIVVGSFVLVGSPSFNRKLSGDKNRIENLRQISSDIESYFEREERLPEVLEDLNSQNYSFGIDIDIVDPTTRKPYDYIKKDPFSYEICADFELTSEEAEIENSTYDYFDRDRLRWEHGVGRSCFPFEIPIAKRVN